MTRTYPSALLSFRHRFACCDEARRRPTTRASASRYSRGHERLSTPAPSAEKVLLTDFCNRPTSRAPATDRSIPGVFGPLSRSAHIQRSHLRRIRRGVSHLTVRSALRSNSRSRFPPIRRLRASLNPGGLRYRRALEGTPLVPRRCLPRARSARRPLTPPVATSSTPFATDHLRGPMQPTLARRQNRLSSEPRQGFCFRAIRGAFHRRVPARSTAPFRRRRTSNASPPPVLGLCRPSIRLPTLFRRLAPKRRWLDRGRYRTLFTLGRSWPRAARRLLQSKRPASTTFGPRNPVPPRWSTFADLPSCGPVHISIGPSPVLRGNDSIEWEPRIHGSGAV